MDETLSKKLQKAFHVESVALDLEECEAFLLDTAQNYPGVRDALTLLLLTAIAITKAKIQNKQEG